MVGPRGVYLVVPVDVVGDLVVVPRRDEGVGLQRALEQAVRPVAPVEVPVVGEVPGAAVADRQIEVPVWQVRAPDPRELPVGRLVDEVPDVDEEVDVLLGDVAQGVE